MSYIQYHNGNYYRPSESLQTLFDNLVLRPFREHPKNRSWVDQVSDRDSEYHRKDILQRGSTHFDEEFEGLSPEDKVSLYCCYYMPMHLFSSYHVFTKHLTLGSDKVVFIDFGCGPLTSGIAFHAAFAEHNDIACISIDESKAMREQAERINTYGHNGTRFFEKGKLTPNCRRLLEDLDNYIVNGDRTQIVFNFCYSLARETFHTEELSIGDLSNVLIRIAQTYSQHQMFVVYQNPRIPQGRDLQSSFLHENWYFLKTQLSMFQSQITQPNTVQFRYDHLIDGLPHTPFFYFDILSNKPSVASNDPVELPF